MEQFTKGEWKYEPDNTDYQDKNRLNCFAGNIVGGEDELNLCIMISDCLEDKVEANAYLIASAVNACAKVNPDNPQAVAESISDLYEALKFLASQVSIMGHFKPETQEWIKQALAKADNKAKAEGG